MSDAPFADPLPPPGPRSPDWAWLVVAVQAALLIVLAGWLLSGLPIGVRGQWAWEVHGKPLPVAGLLRAVLIGAEALGVLWWGLWRIRRKRRSDVGIVAALVLLVFALQIAVASLAPRAGFFLVAGTGSSVATEYFAVARSVRDPWVYCRSYAATQPLGHHVATHPPGAVLTYWLCLRLYESPLFPRRAFAAAAERVIGAPRGAIAVAANSYPGTTLFGSDVGPALLCCLALGVCGALTLAPLYWLASRAASRSTALVVCALFALTPAPVLFFQGLDALVLLLATTATALAYAAVKQQRLGAGALGGLALGLLCAITFGAAAAMVTVAALVVLLILRLPQSQRGRSWACAAVGLAIWLAAIVTLHLLCGGQLHVIFRQAMAAHRALTWEGFGRSYTTWVGLNLVEFVCFLGFPGLVALAIALGGALRRRLRGLSDAELVGLVGLCVLLALDLSGSVRGEVARVWMFLMPPLTLWAGHRLRRMLRERRTVAILTVMLSLLQVLLLGVALTPVVLPY